jgi:hypothetical protein
VPQGFFTAGEDVQRTTRSVEKTIRKNLMARLYR